MTAPSPAKRMRAIAIAAGDAALVPAGFERDQLTWTKPVGEGVEWVVEVEKEKHTHGKDEIGFTVAWGVHVLGFNSMFDGDDRPTPHAWACAVNGRITDLAKRRGGWWIVTTDGTTGSGSVGAHLTARWRPISGSGSSGMRCRSSSR